MAIKTGPPGQGAVLGGGGTGPGMALPGKHSHWQHFAEGDTEAQKEEGIGPYHMGKIGKWDLRQDGLCPWSSLPCPAWPSMSWCSEALEGPEQGALLAQGG